MEITPKELKEKLHDKNLFLLDVRTPDEYTICKIKNSNLIPLQELPNRINEIPKDKEIIVYCHHGPRSLRAASFLKEKGFNVKSLKGGINSFSDLDNSVPKY